MIDPVINIAVASTYYVVGRPGYIELHRISARLWGDIPPHGRYRTWAALSKAREKSGSHGSYCPEQVTIKQLCLVTIVRERPVFPVNDAQRWRIRSDCANRIAHLAPAPIFCDPAPLQNFSWRPLTSASRDSTSQLQFFRLRMPSRIVDYHTRQHIISLLSYRLPLLESSQWL
jgi:hypothetical protein